MVPKSEMVVYTINDRVKLSYHADGFVQFSGEIAGRVISGRNPDTGEAKGMGLLSSPLSLPIRSGPTFSIQAWGLTDFDEVSDRDNAVIFEDEDLYYRLRSNAHKEAYLVEVFLFPLRLLSAVRRKGNRYLLSLFHPGLESIGAVVEFQVFLLPRQPVFFAAMASHIRVNFKSASGWVLNGPGYMDQAGRGKVLMAFYPRSEEEEATLSLDYNPKRP